MIDNAVIPPEQDQLGDPDKPPARTSGQDFGWTGPVFPVPEKAHVGHKADDESWTRSKSKGYQKKIKKQKARMKS